MMQSAKPLSPFFLLRRIYCNTIFQSSSGDTLPVEYRGAITYISKDCNNRYVTSFLICQFEDEPGFPLSLSVFFVFAGRGPAVCVVSLIQSESKCLVHSDECHLIVISQIYFGLHGPRHNGANSEKAFHCLYSNPHYVTTEMDIQRLRRLFVKNAITRSGNVENIWHACEQRCEPPSLDYLQGDKGP